MTMCHTVAPTEQIVDLRCPRGPRNPDGTCSPGKLFAQLRIAGEQPSFMHPDNLIVMACGDCRRWQRREGHDIYRVMHAYNMAGQLVRTWHETGPPCEEPAGD